MFTTWRWKSNWKVDETIKPSGHYSGKKIEKPDLLLLGVEACGAIFSKFELEQRNLWRVREKPPKERGEKGTNFDLLNFGRFSDDDLYGESFSGDQDGRHWLNGLDLK